MTGLINGDYVNEDAAPVPVPSPDAPDTAAVPSEAPGAALVRYQFRPGQSGNPGGRPKRDLASEVARAVFEENADAIYRAMLKALLKGDPEVFAVLADRAYGKLTQKVEIPGIENLPEALAEARARINALK